MTQFRVTQTHFQLHPGDVVTFVANASHNLHSDSDAVVTDAQGDLWVVPASKLEWVVPETE
jgi:quercetin dioxygenase-like cupin family protein